ncbi:hypothetical protein GJ744_010237 [Endocarpon pusillum]|uniref:Uncharacterized protein n=1 Tax=Endocarpon pusillum TaxID=364733 RepID=A0A8H7E220_9EURO|nr:hypothetical protein GJ744_010237 [Endocarpon pusillum]
MSDLFSGDQPGGPSGNGRAQNGGSRAARGAPVPTGGVRTPTEVMRARRERDARRKAQEEEAARLRNLEQEESRRAQEAEAAAALPGEAPVRRRSTRRSGVEVPDASRRTSGGQFSSRRQENIPSVASVTSRPRTSTLDQGQPRPVSQQARVSSRYDRQPGEEPTAGPSRTNRVDLPAMSDENSANPAILLQPTQPSTDPQTGRSTFPNAFERWETLSSHWEGLTSYWIRRLQENSSELNREPLNQQMSRQIVDLSAAGSNLFLAVFELQRLRASSDRKFQRWFFETRSELERYQAQQAELERLLRVEREERARIVSSTGSAEADKFKAEELVKEMRRELQISKEEARRAWEELGRREQEERDRTVSLRSGEPTLVGGVQVVPMTQGVPSRQTTAAGRPQTRDGAYAGGPGAGLVGGQAPISASRTTLESPDEEERQFSYQAPPAASPTDTDPFAEEAARAATRQPTTRTRESARSPELQFYQRPTQPIASPAATAAPRATQPPTYPTIPTSEARGGYSSAHQATTATTNGGGNSRFYPQAVNSAALQPPFSAAAAAAPSITAPPRPGTHNTDLSSHDEPSYIASTTSGAGSSIGDEEYEIDADGNYRLDAEGRRIPWRDPSDPTNGRRYGPVSEEGSEDEYDVQSEIEREREYARRYGAGALRQTQTQAPPPAPQQQQQQQPQYSTSATLSGPLAGPTLPQPTVTRPTVSSPPYSQPLQTLREAPELSPTSAAAAAAAADYSGQGYSPTSNGSGGWESSYTPRHRHPTRLSDIIEQEDERSRRTSPNPSRASYMGSEPGSAGFGVQQGSGSGGAVAGAREVRERFGGGLSGR